MDEFWMDKRVKFEKDKKVTTQLFAMTHPFDIVISIFSTRLAIICLFWIYLSYWITYCKKD